MFYAFAVVLRALVPRDFIEGTLGIQIIFCESAVDEFAFDEFTTCKIRPPKRASCEFHLYEYCKIEQAPVPLTVLKRATNKNRISVSAFSMKISEVAIPKDML